MLKYFKSCLFCGDFELAIHPASVMWRGRHGFAIECERCGARGPFGMDAPEAYAKFKNPAAEEKEV